MFLTKKKRSKKKVHVGFLILASPFIAFSILIFSLWLKYITDSGSSMEEGYRNIDSSFLNNGTTFYVSSRMRFCEQFGGESPHYFVYLRESKKNIMHKTLILRYNSPPTSDARFPELKWISPQKLYIHLGHVNDIVWKVRKVWGINVVYHIDKIDY